MTGGIDDRVTAVGYAIQAILTGTAEDIDYDDSLKAVMIGLAIFVAPEDHVEDEDLYVDVQEALKHVLTNRRLVIEGLRAMAEKAHHTEQ